MESFFLPERLLLGPGPSQVNPRVLGALSRPCIGHLDPEFIRFMDDLRKLLRLAFQTDNAVTFAVSGPGSAGMEFCFVNLVEPGDEVIVCVNGVFGGRMAENARRCGGKVTPVESEWGKPVDPDSVRKAIDANPGARVLAFVHAETSTGVRSDAAALCAMAKEKGILTIVDTVTSLGGIPVEIKKWGADASYSGSQKCLSAPPGLSPVTIGEDALKKIRSRKTPCQSWFGDLSLLLGYWEGGTKRAYHHTAPINALFGLHEALVMLLNEGLNESFTRHEKNHRMLVAGLEALGMKMAVDSAWRLPQLNAVFPGDFEEGALRERLLLEYGIEVGSGLGIFAGKLWRIGLMGHSSRHENVRRLLSALESCMGKKALI